MSRNTKPRRPREEWLGWLGCLVLACVASGCCGDTYADEDLPLTKKLETPFDTIDFVRFAVRNEQWEPLYTALSRRTRRQMFADDSEDGVLDLGIVGGILLESKLDGATFRDFELAVPIPESLLDVVVTDLIGKSQILYVGEAWEPLPGFPRDRQWYVSLGYPSVDLAVSQFLLLDEGTPDAPRWKLGLVETYQWQAHLRRLGRQ